MINAEYQRKIEWYTKNFRTYIVTPVEALTYEGFETDERITLAEAITRARTPIPAGTKWGEPCHYGWFFTKITVPPAAEGKPLIYTSENGECIVWVNGEIRGSLDREHSEIFLTDSARSGEVFDIVMEVYAGDGGRGFYCDHATGPINKRTVDNYKYKTGLLKTAQNGALAIWDELLYKAYIDLRTLHELRSTLPAESARAADIDKALKKAVSTMNFELPYELMRESVRAADKIMEPLLAAKNGSTAAQMYAFGHSHLDLEWLWTDRETRRKIARTVGNQLAMIERYPEYRYLQSQPWLIDVLKNEYPELFERFKAAVKSGNIIVDGAMWVEPDLNVPSGESLIRQIMYGKKFIRDELGVDSRMVWVPDVFGCGCCLPQIIKGCDCDYFFNAKLPWLYNGGTSIPRSTFNWRGNDGTSVPTHLISGYGATCNPGVVCRQMNLYQSKELAPAMAFPFGWSDGGGGAVRDHIEFVRREADLEGMPKVKIAAPAELFEKLCDIGITETYDGELYYCAHRGTYTSQAKTKLLNRKSELALRNAEMLTAIFGGDDREYFEKLWKTVLFNQFHDILPGSSIHEVYINAERELAEIVDSASETAEKALASAVTEDANKLTLFNPLSWAREADILLPDGFGGAYLADGTAAPTQRCEDGVHAVVPVASMGTATVTLGGEPQASVTSDEAVLENELIKAVFNEKGEIVSITDKESGLEQLAGKANRFAMYADMPLFCDAWDIDSYYEELEIPIDGKTEISGVTKGALFSFIDIKKTVGGSELVQRVILKNGSKQLDFVTEVDWNESHKLLKVYFDTNINTSKITSEMQYGFTERPAHRSDAYSKERFEVCQHKWSALCESKRIFAVLNDCKYGVGAVNGCMGVSLLKSACDPDLTADKGHHKFTYSVLLTDDITSVVKAAWELNVPAITARGDFKDTSSFSVDADNIIIDTVKCAEDGSGDIIVRLYECSGTMTRCALTASLDVKTAKLCDMVENVRADAEIKDGKVTLTLHGFEAVTVRFAK